MTMVLQQQARTFHLAHRGDARRAQRFQTFQFLSREHQCREFGLSSHVPHNIADDQLSANVLMKRCASCIALCHD
jgi:hypothetical protein